MTTDADLLRQCILDLGLSQREAARQLVVDERAMRRYCAGSIPIPPLLLLALDRLAMIQRNSRVIELLEDGTLSTGDGPLTLAQFENTTGLCGRRSPCSRGNGVQPYEARYGFDPQHSP